jgi:hypothetical protein
VPALDDLGQQRPDVAEELMLPKDVEITGFGNVEAVEAHSIDRGAGWRRNRDRPAPGFGSQRVSWKPPGKAAS